MKERGLAIAFISQRLQDIEPVADRVTVLRDGALVDTLDIADADEATITRLMVGRSLTDYFHREIATGETSADEPVLSVRELTVPGRVEGLSLDVRPRGGRRDRGPRGLRTRRGRAVDLRRRRRVR